MKRTITGIMSEIDRLFADLDLDFERVEAEFRVDEEREAIGSRLRLYGAVDRAYERAVEFTREMGIDLPSPDECGATVYREIRASGWEAGGGVQLYGHRFGPAGLTRCAVRVPAYTLNEERAIRPAGGVFDDHDAAEMVAAQADGLAAVAKENDVELTTDLTSYPRQAEEMMDLIVITCPPRDAI
jgi:hypothetical protein